MSGALISSPEESRLESTNEFSQGSGRVMVGRGGSLGALEEQEEDPGFGSWPYSHEHPTFQGWVSEAEGTQGREKHRAVTHAMRC